MGTDPFIVEAWIWYPLTMTIVVARYVSRLLQAKSIRRLDKEDLCMLLVAGLYTAEVIYLVKLKFTPTNLIAPGEVLHLDDPAEVALRRFGSKLIVAQEMNFCAVIWGTKACLLLFYSKMTYALPGSFRWTKLTAAYVAIGYVVMVILYFTAWCRPFYNYWSVPVANPQCATAEDHLILNFTLNVTSDLMILGIPLPLLARSKLPIGKKLVLIAAFSLGLFVIMSATMNRYYSFTHLNGAAWVFWFVREASTAVIVANIPHLWWLLRKAFNLNTFINTPITGRSPSLPSRFYDSVEDPLTRSQTKRRPTHVSSLIATGEFDIDMVIADVEHGLDSIPPQARLRDAKGPPAFSPSLAALVCSDKEEVAITVNRAEDSDQSHESAELTFITVHNEKS